MADVPAEHLNIAERKRKGLEIARALTARPRLLLLNEVMAGLAATEVAEAVALIQTIRSGHAVAPS
jgi:branched-chain amino acid transport system ATP-binding protein